MRIALPHDLAATLHLVQQHRANQRARLDILPAPRLYDTVCACVRVNTSQCELIDNGGHRRRFGWGELYDLGQGPWEFENLWDELVARSVKQKMQTLLVARKSETVDPHP